MICFVYSRVNVGWDLIRSALYRQQNKDFNNHEILSIYSERIVLMKYRKI